MGHAAPRDEIDFPWTRVRMVLMGTPMSARAEREVVSSEIAFHV